MPTTTTTVGGLTIPIPAGTANTAIDDIAVAGILDYLAFWIKDTLDAKVANQGAPTVQTISDACPTANRFSIDPEQVHVRVPRPCLFVWWDGASVVREHSLVYNIRERTINALYVFADTRLKAGADMREGLINAVDATFARAVKKGFHPSYGYGSDADGTPLRKSVGLLHWIYRGGTEGTVQEMLSQSLRDGANGQPIQRGYPSLRGVFTIFERVGEDVGEVPDDANTDATFTIETGDTTADTVEILDRILPHPPDGS